MLKIDLHGNPLLSRPERVNPYYDGIKLIGSRLLWDLGFVSIGSRRKITAYKDVFSKKKAVILCNGPSLNKVDFDLLDSSGVKTFGLNKINLLYDKTSFRPSFIVSVNPFVIEQNRDYFNDTEIPIFLDKNARKVIMNRSNVNFFHSSNQNGLFARDCSLSIVQGYTVTYVAMQLAFHMGFDEVALVGCDHSFATNGVSNQLQRAAGVDASHFDARYFSGGDLWQLPDLMQSEYHYNIAKLIFEGAGRAIYNCTEGGLLDIFSRMPLEEFVDAK